MLIVPNENFFSSNFLFYFFSRFVFFRFSVRADSIDFAIKSGVTCTLVEYAPDCVHKEARKENSGRRVLDSSEWITLHITFHYNDVGLQLTKTFAQLYAFYILITLAGREIKNISLFHFSAAEMNLLFCSIFYYYSLAKCRQRNKIQCLSLAGDSVREISDNRKKMRKIIHLWKYFIERTIEQWYFRSLHTQNRRPLHWILFELIKRFPIRVRQLNQLWPLLRERANRTSDRLKTVNPNWEWRSFQRTFTIDVPISYWLFNIYRE